MKPNVKLLKKVRKLIAAEPRRLKMLGWGWRYTEADDIYFNPGILPPCRTVCCLAGNILLANASTKKQRDRLFRPSGEMRDGVGPKAIARRAAKLIRIDVAACPFWKFGWRAPDVLAWLDRQIDAAAK